MSELAADNIPVAVSLRALKLSRQPYYRWLKPQVTEAEVIEAYRANALLDPHRDDPEFGHRFLVGEAAEAGEEMCERTAWRICRDNQWWSVFGKKRGKNGKRPGPPVHDDLVKRDFSADDVNELWLTDIPPRFAREVPPPSPGPMRASSTSAPSRTSSPAASSATRSATG